MTQHQIVAGDVVRHKICGRKFRVEKVGSWCVLAKPEWNHADKDAWARLDLEDIQICQSTNEESLAVAAMRFEREEIDAARKVYGPAMLEKFLRNVEQDQ